MTFRTLPARLVVATALATGALIAPATVQAQATAEQASAAAFQRFTSGDYKQAVADYEAILKNYPTSTVIPEAQFRLGYLHYLLGEHDKALPFLRKVLAPPASTELQELGASMIPQVLSGKAALEKDEKKREAAFKQAIAEFDNFLKKYPASDQVETANYGRALALYQIANYTDAATSLRTNLQQFAKSESILDSQYLLALVLATEGAQLAQKDPNSAEATARFTEAEKLLSDIIAKKVDIALANEAQFQIGELFFNRALLAPEAAKPELWKKALEAYRDVQPKGPMVEAQQARIAAVRQRKDAAVQARNLPEFRRLGRLEEAEVGKLETVKGKGDLTVASQVKAGQAYLQQKRYDEARVLLRQMKVRAESADQQKALQYFITLTYASQNLLEPAVAAYNEFQSAHKGDPMAENLPLVIGTLYLAREQPDKATEYFAEGLKIYPKGAFTADTMGQQATALLQQRRYDDALKTYRDFLATKPRAELAAQAELGIATILKDTGKIDDALTAYKKVRDTYKETPQGEQAFFWVGDLLRQKNDAANAITELTAFTKAYPQSQLLPAALFYIASSEASRNNKPRAMELFKEVADKHPESQAAPYAYTARAEILQGEQKNDEVVALMREFISRYPQDPNLFAAYNRIAQLALAAGKPEEAIATYNELVEKHAQDPNAANALLSVIRLWAQHARSQGPYLALNEEQRKEWDKGVKNSVASVEKLLAAYPESPAVALALQELLANQKLLLAAKLTTDADVTKYFEQLASKAEGNAATRNKILFTLAAFTHEKDKAKALEQMKAAYSPDLVYAAADLDLFGSALLAAGDGAKSTEVYTKLANDYPNPPGVDPTKAPAQVQEAQAISLYGRGKAIQAEGKVAEAGALFDQLKKLYPWSPKMLEANYGIAEAMVGQGKGDDAALLLAGIVRAQTAPAELRARAMLLLGKIQEAKGDFASAADQYIKIAVFFEALDELAPEGLWRGAQVLEKQAATLSDEADPKKGRNAPTRSGQLKKAAKAYNDLATKYADSPHAKDAKARAAALAPAK